MKKRYLLFFFLALLAIVSCKIDPVNTYKIEINKGDGSTPYTQMVLGESVFNLPSVSPKDGNIFLGWYKDDTLLVGKSIFVDKDIALEGKWYTTKNYILFNGNKTINACVNVLSVFTLSYPEEDYPSSLSWRWMVDDEEIANNTSSITLKASDYKGLHTFTLVCNDIKIGSIVIDVVEDRIYSISYKLDDNLAISYFGIPAGQKRNINVDTQDADLIIPDDKVLKDCIVQEPLYLNIDDNSFIMPECDVVFQCVMDAKKYSVTIVNTEGLVLSQNEIEPQYPGTIVKLPIATTQEGFEESWTMNGEVVKNSFTMPKCDVVLEVTQKSKPHKVIIDNPNNLNLSYYTHSDAYVDEVITLPKVLSDLGDEYSAYFYVNGKPYDYDKVLMGDSDITISVRKEGKTFNIITNLDGWNNPYTLPTKAKYGTKVDYSQYRNITKEGYTITGWKFTKVGSSIAIPKNGSDTIVMPLYDIEAKLEYVANKNKLIVSYGDDNHKAIPGTKDEEDNISYDSIVDIKKYIKDIAEYKYLYSELIVGGKVTAIDDQFKMPNKNATLRITYSYTGKLPVGGDIFMDLGKEYGVDYKFYDKDKKEIAYDGSDITLLKDAEYYVKLGQSTKDRFYVAYLDKELKVNSWGFMQNTDLLNIKMRVGYGRENTNFLTSYIEKYCLNEVSGETPDEKISSSSSIKYNLYRNSGKDQGNYALDVFMSWLKNRRENEPKDYYIPSKDEMFILAHEMIKAGRFKNFDYTTGKDMLEKGIWSSSSESELYNSLIYYTTSYATGYFQKIITSGNYAKRSDSADHYIIPVRSF